MILSLLLSSQVNAPRLASLSATSTLAASVVNNLNAGDAKGLASLALPEFFDTIPADRLPGLVAQVHRMGHLSAPKLSLDLGEKRFYRVVIKREGKPDLPIIITLGAQSSAKFFLLGLSPERKPNPQISPFKSDNPLRTQTDKAVDDAVKHYFPAVHPVGLSIAFEINGSKHYYNYGESKLGTGKQPTPNTVYEIGSITKSMTGLLIAQAIKDKKLNLDQDIRKLLPGKFPNLEFNGKPILLRHLVTHTSGLPPNPPGIPDDGKADAYQRYSHGELLKDLAKVSLSKSPGSEFSYSNMGGGLAGLILQHVYGIAYEKLLQKYIFIPQKMNLTGIALTLQMKLNFAAPYDGQGNLTDPWEVNGIESAGAVRSTSHDLLSYTQFNRLESNPVVKLSHVDQTSGKTKQFGLFWVLGSSRIGGRYFSHEGGTGGFTGHLLILPTKKISVVILMNSGEQQAGDLAYEIMLRLLYPKNVK